MSARVVSLSGDTAIVASRFAANDEGLVQVFERNAGGPDLWGQVATLTAPDAETLDHLGAAAVIDGDTIVAGAPNDDDACPEDRFCDSGAGVYS